MSLSKCKIFPLLLLCILTTTADKDLKKNNLLGFGGVQDRIIKTECEIVIGKPNKIYENVVSKDKPMTFIFEVDRKYILGSHVSDDHTTQLRVEVGVQPNLSQRYPTLFVVRQQKYVSTMELPTIYQKIVLQKTSKSAKPSNISNTFYYSARTLCIDKSTGTVARNVTVRVTTQNPNPTKFTLFVGLTEELLLPIDREVSFHVGPTTPKFYRVPFARPDLTRVKIRVTSETSNCMTISVQTVECPIFDLERNVRYQGLWQTMSTSAAMTVEKVGQFSKGFILVFVVHMSNELCGRRDTFSATATNRSMGFLSIDGHNWRSNEFGGDPRTKTVKVLIMDESKIAPWIIFLCLLIPIVVTLAICLVVLALFRNRHEWMVKILREKFQRENALNPVLRGSIGTPPPEEPVEENNEEQTALDRMMRLSSGSNTPPAYAGLRPSSLIQGKVYHSEVSNTKSSRFGFRSNLTISDFHCKAYEEAKKTSKRFYWTIGIVAIFYCIPVYQLVAHYLRVLWRTGEYDICYYNYLCAQKLGFLIDFNHFWSNTSYVIFGFLYIAIVRRRSQNLCLPQSHKMHMYRNGKKDGSLCCSCCSGKVGSACFCTFSRICFRWDHGVPAHFGVFHALGVALAIEGFLSAAYHLCPNQSTFQFDTCFMYVIAVLLLLKIYQFRHPVHFGANQTFAILAGFVAISVVGLMFERGTEKAILIFKCIYLPIQYIVMILISIYYYAVGYVKNEDGKIVTDWNIYRYLGQLKSQRINGDRLILPFISFAICIAVLVYSELSNIGFASYLLYILVGNVLGTTLYYVGIMKPLHGEFKNWTWVQPTIYFAASAVIGGFSLQYFVRAPAQWELSASASRAENEECLDKWFPFHPFYDSHDAWHFMSAAALFLAFMGLLIVDDDLITTPQTKIPVF